MDIKSLLQSFDTIAEDSKVHKGTYGTSHGKEDVRDQYGHKIGKINKDAESKKDAPKKGRGRPKKGSDDSGEVKSYDTKSLGDVFGGGKKPSKEVGKKSVKHSLKDWIEDVAHSKSELHEGEVTVKPMPGASQIIGQDGKPMGTADAQTANVIKAASDKGTLNLAGDSELSEKFDKPVKTNPAEKGKYEGKSKQELLKAYHHLKKTGPHEKGSKPYGNMKELAFAIRAKGDWGKVKEEGMDEAVRGAIVGDQGVRPPVNQDERDYVANKFKQTRATNRADTRVSGYGDRVASQSGMKSGSNIGSVAVKTEPSYHGKEMSTSYRNPRMQDPEHTDGKSGNLMFRPGQGKGVAEAKDLPGKQEKLDVAKPKGKLDAKDFAALRAKKKVKESQIMKIVESINFKELMATADSEIQEMLIELQNDVEMFKDTGHSSELLDSFLKVHLHHNKNKITDEGSIQTHTTHGMDSTPSKFNAVDPNPAPTSFKVDPIQATTDRVIDAGAKAGSFLKNLVAPKKTFESNTMKDIQLENWEKELNSLLKLNEGITVSSSTGQQGSPDSVSVNATDADAQQLLQVLRQAGVGVFGGEEAHSDYGAPMNGDTEGHGTEPEMSPAVVGDGDDMMALIKKMTGIQDSGDPHGEQPGTLEPAGEEGNDYEDEEGHGGEEEHGSDGHDHEEEEEVTDEGNAFSGAVAKAKSDGIQPGEKINVGGQEYPVKEEGMEHDHEEGGTCNECGMYEARCVCEPGQEQVEENFANEPDEEMMKLKALLGLGGDLHRQKQSQAVGNPTQVTFETKLLKDSSNLLTDWQKLSGIK